MNTFKKKPPAAGQEARPHREAQTGEGVQTLDRPKLAGEIVQNASRLWIGQNKE